MNTRSSSRSAGSSPAQPHRLRCRRRLDGRERLHGRDSLKDEQIYFCDESDYPAVAKYADQWAREQVKTGEQARAFAQIMRYHTVNGEWNPEHLTYSQSRFLDKADPGNPKGTSDEAVALQDETGKPVANAFRNVGDGDRAAHGAERQLHGREPRPSSGSWSGSHYSSAVSASSSSPGSRWAGRTRRRKSLPCPRRRSPLRRTRIAGRTRRRDAPTSGAGRKRRRERLFRFPAATVHPCPHAATHSSRSPFRCRTPSRTTMGRAGREGGRQGVRLLRPARGPAVTLKREESTATLSLDGAERTGYGLGAHGG